MMVINIRWQLILPLALWAGLNLPAFAVQPGEQAPKLVLPQLNSEKTIHLSELRGKVVYVDFWASWCAPCRQSLPLYEAMVQRLPADKFQLLAVNLDEETSDAEKFLKRHPVSYTILSDPAGNSASEWSVLVMPSSYLVDSVGNLAYIYRGFEASHIGEIERDIQTLLRGMPGHITDTGADTTDSLR